MEVAKGGAHPGGGEGLVLRGIQDLAQGGCFAGAGGDERYLFCVVEEGSGEGDAGLLGLGLDGYGA